MVQHGENLNASLIDQKNLVQCSNLKLCKLETNAANNLLVYGGALNITTKTEFNFTDKNFHISLYHFFQEMNIHIQNNILNMHDKDKYNHSITKNIILYFVCIFESNATHDEITCKNTNIHVLMQSSILHTPYPSFHNHKQQHIYLQDQICSLGSIFCGQRNGILISCWRSCPS